MIVSLINLKGGVGKTTTAMALATCANADGLAAEVWDCDPQGSAGLWAEMAAGAGEPLPFGVRPMTAHGLPGAAEALRGDPSSWAFVDCPPSGRVTDAALRASDLVVVPTRAGAGDLAKAVQTATVADGRGVLYAVLLVAVEAGTVALRDARAALEARGLSYFDAKVPARQAVVRAFGRRMDRADGSLAPYGAVWAEVRDALGVPEGGGR